MSEGLRVEIINGLFLVLRGRVCVCTHRWGKGKVCLAHSYKDKARKGGVNQMCSRRVSGAPPRDSQQGCDIRSVPYKAPWSWRDLK